MKKLPANYYSLLDQSKNLLLPDWGPYSKRYFGISHVADKDKGHRMDFFLVPQIYRQNNIGIPDVLRNSNYLPMDCKTDLSYYMYRQQLEWKDKIYCDISYQNVEENLYLAEARFVNNTGKDLDFAIHCFLHFAPNPAVISFGGTGEGAFLSCLDYSSINILDSQEYCYGVTWDARKWYQHPEKGAYKGSALGMGFGYAIGDMVSYDLPESLRNPASGLFLRYKLSPGKVVLNVNKQHQIILNDTGGDYISIPIPAFEGEKLTLEVVESQIEKNNFLFLDGLHSGNYERKIEDMTGVKGVFAKDLEKRSLFYSHEDLAMTYGVKWDRKESICRSYAVPDFHALMCYRSALYDPNTPFDTPTGNDRYYGVCLQPLTVRKHGEIELALLIGGGENKEKLEALLENKSSFLLPSREKAPRLPEKSDNPLAFTRKTLNAVTLTNIVYPIRLQEEWIKHHTPGRMWDSLYTWDSAFIGLGLLEMDPRRTVENLNTYLNSTTNINPFVHRGSFVPAHILLFHECANFLYGKDKEDYLQYFFERAYRYYAFLAGHDPNSNTASFSKIGLLRPWKQGYNSGGWDDYPAQWYIHKHQAHHILPAVTTSFAVMCAKVLLPYAERLGKMDLADVMRKDIERFSKILQLLWDEESGFFSYAVHNEEGEFTGFFRTENGENFNKGLDGVMPLAAGCVTPHQEKSLWEKVLDPERFFTPCGISCVDMTASYYYKDGYANGTPWMATEYYLWKRALAEGKANIAWKIASNTLKNYDKELRRFRQCFEHFSCSSSCGTGWHHFSSFSTPILAWCAAYYNEDLHLAGGFELLVDSLADHKAEITLGGEKGTWHTVVLAGKKDDKPIFYNGKKVAFKKRTPFAWELKLPAGTKGPLEF